MVDWERMTVSVARKDLCSSLAVRSSFLACIDCVYKLLHNSATNLYAAPSTSEDVHRPTLATMKDLSQNLDPSSSQCGFGPDGGFVPSKRRPPPIERVIATSSHHTHTHEHKTIQNVEFRAEDLQRQPIQPSRQHHQRHQLRHALQVSWKSPTQ